MQNETTIQQSISPAQVTSSQSPTGRQTVTVIIPTLNVEEIISKCLNSLCWADEVIVVDMFSTDRTEEVCRNYPNVRFLQRKDYIYANVNYGIDEARTEWVIRLDSDEILDVELQQSILQALTQPNPGNICYVFPFVQYMFGQPMHHGVGLPNLCRRRCMFRRGTARYACKLEHEDITFNGGEVILNGFYHHLSNMTAYETVSKINYYTSKDAERLIDGELHPPHIGHILYRGMRMFILYYFQWKGYKDGYLGFFSSLYRGPIYQFLDETKRWEAWRDRKPQP